MPVQQEASLTAYKNIANWKSMNAEFFCGVKDGESRFGRGDRNL
jgi:hypothetical protein